LNEIPFYYGAASLITRIQKLFGEDLAKENDFLRRENKMLRSKTTIGPVTRSRLLHTTFDATSPWKRS